VTFGELTSDKLLDFQIRESSAFGMVPRDGTEVLQRCGGYTYEQGELRGRVGKERGGKETDRCPLTLPPLQRCGITTHKDRQEVSRSTLVKGIFYHVSHFILLSQCLQHLLKTLETTPDLYLDELRFELQQTYGVSVDTSTVW
jgi:hypothetical protein